MPSIATHFSQHGILTCTSDAADCQGIGPRSYGTIFEVYWYDGNNHLMPYVFYYYVGTESYQSWSAVFRNCKEVKGFDVTGRTKIVYLEKYIESSFRETMEFASIFWMFIVSKKNILPHLGLERSNGPSLYERALGAPCVE